MAVELPQLPVPIPEFVQYVTKHPKSQAGVVEAVGPFKTFESKLRELYAQHPDHPAVTANYLVPIFDSPPITTRARDLSNESTKEKDSYLLSLKDEQRRKHDSPATVQSLKDFRTNFNLFSESSLVDLDWNNVVVAGSAVNTSLLPVEAPHNESKRALRNYYHEKLAPASDVDLFLYGLSEDEALVKIKQIETKIRDSILSETTTVRTKNTITIVSEYPTRHVQIVLRLYKSVSEILTGFDVDSSCVAYDGQQVWASPRAIAAFMTQVNTIDLTRRSPSYENRLSKYSHRGFEVYWPNIERNRVDPTIFERSFSRVQGLARLLVLEKLPHPNDRDEYLEKRREERGRPPIHWSLKSRNKLSGNVKDAQPDDVAEWVEEDEISSYHTVTIPYGPKYNAKRIEKLLFTQDLLLNAEWNKPKDRETTLHRHPAFFGFVDDVIHDCCGFCPEPTTDADLAALEEESKLYISGDVKFLKDDPGRQAIGSFNPITDEDWTEMAYVGTTTRLCQAIVDQDVDAVRDWFSSPDVTDVNRRDHTGRTPLQLAAMCSTPEIVQVLIEHGARLVSRLYNGMTALHLAAHRGEVQIVKELLEKSLLNEEEESRKEDSRKEARRAAAGILPNNAGEVNDPDSQTTVKDTDEAEDDEDEDWEKDSDQESNDSMTEGSFVKVEEKAEVNDPLAEDKDEPDVYDVNVLAWDSPLSPLHLAILAGHLDVVEVLIDKYGADVLLPVKIMSEWNLKEAKAAILTIVLALELPLKQANQTIKTLLSHGATSTQADMNHISALHFAVNSAKVMILDTMNARDPTAVTKACNYLSVTGYWANFQAPILTAIRTGRVDVVKKLLSLGTNIEIGFGAFAEAYKRGNERNSDDHTRVNKIYQKQVEQPIILAAKMEMIDIVDYAIDNGVNVNTISTGAWRHLEYPSYGGDDKSLLDIIQDRIRSLEEALEPVPDDELQMPEDLGKDDNYLNFDETSYQYWTAHHDLRDARLLHRYQVKDYEEELRSKSEFNQEGVLEKNAAMKDTLSKLRKLEDKLLGEGAKSFYDIHPEAVKHEGYRANKRAANNEPYETKISFMMPDLTPEKEENYVKLFEACWSGDVETVRTLCLTDSRPLQVAITDRRGFSPFSISAIRGHYELAQLIIEIATVQYQPSDKSQNYHYTLRAEREDDDSCGYDSDESVESEVGVFGHLVNDNFTVDDVAAIADNVKSKVSPFTMFSWSSQVSRAVDASVDEQTARKLFSHLDKPYAYVDGYSQQSWAWFNDAYDNMRRQARDSLVRLAIVTDNMRLLKFLIKTGNGLAQQQKEGDTLKVYAVEKSDFEIAVRLGRVEMIGEIIKTTGFGFPLQKMIQQSGVKLDEKPEYYQGLTVHGKKRQDFIDAARNVSLPNPVESDLGVPLLSSVVEGNLESTEYFLSDAPLRRYLEFAETFKDDKRIQALTQTRGGIEGTLTSWLSTRNSLALHISVLSPPDEGGNQPTFDYLLKRMPNSIDMRFNEGKTALHLAFETGHYYAAQKLIDAGANQATKDTYGRNILHQILSGADVTNLALTRSLLQMFDQKLLPSLLLERCGNDQGATTPLGFFLKEHTSGTDWEPVLRLILHYSGGKDLERMDGVGDYPLHSAVRQRNVNLVKFLVEYRPGLLYWENATGMTPVEMATTSYLRSQIDHPPQLVSRDQWSIKDKPAKEFVRRPEQEPSALEEEDDDGDNGSKAQDRRMYQLITSLMKKYPAKRKLVSLHDANEVAKRVAFLQQKMNKDRRQVELRRLGKPVEEKHEVDSADGGPDLRDDVRYWLDYRRSNNNVAWDLLKWRKEVANEDGIDEVIEKEKTRLATEWVLGDMNENPLYGRPSKRLSTKAEKA